MRLIPSSTRGKVTAGVLIAALLIVVIVTRQSGGASLATKFAWPETDFSQSNIDFGEILSGGPRKDGIPSIDSPQFGTIADVKDFLVDTEPVASIVINGDARAYPMSIMIWHEIVNDEVGGVPVSMTFCPLCNSVIAFDRRINGQILDFGTTGKLRFSDLVMYDRQTESWWQQFIGEGIVGEMTGQRLEMIPSRTESFARFKERFPDGRVLLPPQNARRSYGQNPYAGYDTSSTPFLFRGEFPEDIAPMAYVVAVGDQAWSLDLLKNDRRIETNDGLIISWEPGMSSTMDARIISQGQDLGNVVVQRRNAAGELEDVVHDLTFSFAFNAFNPGGTINQ